MLECHGKKTQKVNQFFAERKSGMGVIVYEQAVNQPFKTTSVTTVSAKIKIDKGFHEGTLPFSSAITYFVEGCGPA
jgi:hypothetical protein